MAIQRRYQLSNEAGELQCGNYKYHGETFNNAQVFVNKNCIKYTI